MHERSSRGSRTVGDEAEGFFDIHASGESERRKKKISFTQRGSKVEAWRHMGVNNPVILLVKMLLFTGLFTVSTVRPPSAQHHFSPIKAAGFVSN
jgi:hypothetical protein